MARTPTPTKIYRQLQDVVTRMDTVEGTLKGLEVVVGKLDKWHQNTEFAKKILKEYQEEHPEANQPNYINGKAWAAVLAALAALTAVVLALSKLIK